MFFFPPSVEPSILDCLLIPVISDHGFPCFEKGAVQTKMGTVCFFETPAGVYQLTQPNVPEEHSHQFYSAGLSLDCLTLKMETLHFTELSVSTSIYQ